MDSPEDSPGLSRRVTEIRLSRRFSWTLLRNLPDSPGISLVLLYCHSGRLNQNSSCQKEISGSNAFVKLWEPLRDSGPLSKKPCVRNLANELPALMFSQNFKNVPQILDLLVKNPCVRNLANELPALMFSQNFRDVPQILDLLVKNHCVRNLANELPERGNSYYREK